MDYFDDPTVDIMKLATEQEKTLRDLKEKRNQSKKRTKELSKQLKVRGKFVQKRTTQIEVHMSVDKSCTLLNRSRKVKSAIWKDSMTKPKRYVLILK